MQTHTHIYICFSHLIVFSKSADLPKKQQPPSLKEETAIRRGSFLILQNHFYR